MPIGYPAHTIWYIEASSVDGMVSSSGSAVAIRLQRIREPRTAKNWLLTCAHVVRGPASDGQTGFGAVYENIRVWAPGKPFNDDRSMPATVADSIKPLRTGKLTDEEWPSAADDWAVLEVANSEAISNAHVVRNWAMPAKGALKIIGFPGGQEGFLDGTVYPTESLGPVAYQRDLQGRLHDRAWHGTWHGWRRRIQ